MSSPSYPFHSEPFGQPNTASKRNAITFVQRRMFKSDHSEPINHIAHAIEVIADTGTCKQPLDWAIFLNARPKNRT